MDDRVFKAKIEMLRSGERVRMLEVDRVVALSLENINAGSVLDVGTGSALFAEAFAGKNLAVSGVDINEKMIAEARKFVPKAKFYIGEAENLPFDGNEFDIVFLGQILHETGNMEQALSESKRVARQRVVILEWPYLQEENGPPLAHRLKSEDIIQTAESIGYSKIEEISLNHMVFFRLEKPQ